MSSANIDLPNYFFIHNTSDSCAGGTGLYISNKPTFVTREDLSNILSYSGVFESFFFEIKFKNKQNILVGCIYKHPSMDNDYINENLLSPLLNKIARENKFCVLLGVFNINLLHCERSLSNANFLGWFSSTSSPYNSSYLHN